MLKSLIKNKRRGNRIEHWLRQKDKALPLVPSSNDWRNALWNVSPGQLIPWNGANTGSLLGGAFGGMTATNIQQYMNAVTSTQGAI